MIMLQKYLLNKNRIEQKVCPAIVELSETLVQNAAHQMEYQTNAIEVSNKLSKIIYIYIVMQLLYYLFLEFRSH